MKLKKVMILFGTVCMLDIMVAGCGSGFEPAAKTEGNQAGETLPEEGSDVPLEATDGNNFLSLKRKR